MYDTRNRNGLAAGLLVGAWLGFVAWDALLMFKDMGGIERARSMKDVIAATSMVMTGLAFAGSFVAVTRGTPLRREVRNYTHALWVFAALALGGGIYARWLDMRISAEVGADSLRKSAPFDFASDVLLIAGVLLALVGRARRIGSRFASSVTTASALALLLIVPVGSVIAMWWFVKVRPAEAAQA